MYAAHDDFSIYAIGYSREQALQNAIDAANDPTARFEVSEINDQLADRIERDGWNGNRQSFGFRNGMIVDTTDD